MLLAEITRNENPVCSLHCISPFIFVYENKYRQLKSSWTLSCDDIFDIKTRTNVKQVSENYLTKYIQELSYAEMLLQESSWYFDDANQLIYIHINHKENPLTAIIDYGYAFGVTNNELVYINDYEYLPLVKDFPDINRETDYTNSEQPTGSTGSLTLSNLETDNGDGIKYGRLDFMIDESIYGNDIYLYRYENDILYPISSKYIENITIGLEEVEIDLQDRRFS